MTIDIRTALVEVTNVLEELRRGYGVEVSGKCYPALNNARAALEAESAPASGAVDALHLSNHDEPRLVVDMDEPLSKRLNGIALVMGLPWPSQYRQFVFDTLHEAATAITAAEPADWPARADAGMLAAMIGWRQCDERDGLAGDAAMMDRVYHALYSHMRDTKRAIQPVERRDSEWVVAMGKALGMDSRILVPTVPDVRLLKKLFDSVIEWRTPAAEAQPAALTDTSGARVSDVMRWVDAYAFDYQKEGKLAASRRTVGMAITALATQPAALTQPVSAEVEPVVTYHRDDEGAGSTEAFAAMCARLTKEDTHALCNAVAHGWKATMGEGRIALTRGDQSTIKFLSFAPPPAPALVPQVSGAFVEAIRVLSILKQRYDTGISDAGFDILARHIRALATPSPLPVGGAEPLTDEQLDEIQAEVDGFPACEFCLPGVHRIARTIERAHGIGLESEATRVAKPTDPYLQTR